MRWSNYRAVSLLASLISANNTSVECQMSAAFCLRSLPAPMQLASLVVARTTPPEELAAMRQLFESLDTDSTGTISYEKLHKGLDEKCHVRLACKTHRIQFLARML